MMQYHNHLKNRVFPLDQTPKQEGLDWLANTNQNTKRPCPPSSKTKDIFLRKESLAAPGSLKDTNKPERSPQDQEIQKNKVKSGQMEKAPPLQPWTIPRMSEDN